MTVQLLFFLRPVFSYECTQSEFKKNILSFFTDIPLQYKNMLTIMGGTTKAWFKKNIKCFTLIDL